MSLSYSYNHLGSIWHHSEPSEGPYNWSGTIFCRKQALAHIKVLASVRLWSFDKIRQTFGQKSTNSKEITVLCESVFLQLSLVEPLLLKSHFRTYAIIDCSEMKENFQPLFYQPEIIFHFRRVYVDCFPTRLTFFLKNVTLHA